MNQCNFLGNLTHDVELSEVQVKEGVTSKGTLRLALNTAADKTTFIDVTVWGKTAENAAKYLKKGNPVRVTAHVENNIYEKDGVKHYTLQFTADDVEFIATGKGKTETT